MNFEEIIKNRRSIRKFKNEKIDRQNLIKIINSGRLAPSAKNRQPWYFVILEGEEKNQIANIMKSELKSENLEYDLKKLNCDNSVNETANSIIEASTLILIFKNKDRDWLIGDCLSIGACVENMCLMATDLGYGSLWIRDIADSQLTIEKYLNKENIELICGLLLGISDENPNSRPRKELKDIIEWY